MQTAKQRYTLWTCTACSLNHIFAACLLVKLFWKRERCAEHSANGFRQRLTLYVNREVKCYSKWRSPAEQAVKETIDCSITHWELNTTAETRWTQRRASTEREVQVYSVTWTCHCDRVACWDDLLQVLIVKTWHKEKGQPLFLHWCAFVKVLKKKKNMCTHFLFLFLYVICTYVLIKFCM